MGSAVRRPTLKNESAQPYGQAADLVLLGTCMGMVNEFIFCPFYNARNEKEKHHNLEKTIESRMHAQQSLRKRAQVLILI